jgi:UDP-glucose 4-epimerase
MSSSAALGGRRVLVTGGAGFIGSHLSEELLRRGAHVTIADDLSAGRLANVAAIADRVDTRSVDLLHGDLAGLLSRSPFDVVFHLAGSVHVAGSVERPRRDLELNGLATFNLLEALRAHAPQTSMLFASTAAVYGEGLGRPFKEDDPTVPVAPYGVSKLMAERYVAIYSSLYGLHAASLRLFPVFGSRQRQHVVYDLLTKLEKDPSELRIEGDGSQVRDFTHVSDVVGAFVHVAEHAPLRGEAYNVSTGNPMTVADLARAICRQAGVEARLAFTGQVRAGVAKSWTADVSRLRSLGHRPRLSVEEGLAETVEWFRREARARALAAGKEEI